jgi:cell division GTPase FtsZ
MKKGVRMETARGGIKRLTKSCNTVVVIDNNKLVKVSGELPFQQALGVANELVGCFIKDITETISTASLINLDYMDLRTKQGLETAMQILLIEKLKFSLYLIEAFSVIYLFIERSQKSALACC